MELLKRLLGREDNRPLAGMNCELDKLSVCCG